MISNDIINEENFNHFEPLFTNIGLIKQKFWNFVPKETDLCL